MAIREMTEVMLIGSFIKRSIVMRAACKSPPRAVAVIIPSITGKPETTDISRRVHF
jgi:hypothetical protein